MSLRFSIALVMLATAMAYALFKIYQARPGAGHGRAQLPEEERLRNLLLSIPAGRVMTYTGVAEQWGSGHGTRKIAQAIRGLADQDTVPWWRVVRQSGKVGQVIPASMTGKRQQRLLGEEGVRFKDGGFPLAEYEWMPGN